MASPWRSGAESPGSTWPGSGAPDCRHAGARPYGSAGRPDRPGLTDPFSARAHVRRRPRGSGDVQLAEVVRRDFVVARREQASFSARPERHLTRSDEEGPREMLYVLTFGGDPIT